MAAEVTFAPFDTLFDHDQVEVLVRIFSFVCPDDLDRCLLVCHTWRSFIRRQLASNGQFRRRIVNSKLPYEWLNKQPQLSRLAIGHTLAPPLRIHADRRDIVLTTVDSFLVWHRRSKSFKKEVGPRLEGNCHLMIEQLSFNDKYIVTTHRHNSNMLVWNRATFRLLHQHSCVGIEGEESKPCFIHFLEDGVRLLSWLCDGSLWVFRANFDGSLSVLKALNGHLRGNHEASVDHSHLLTASMDSKVNMWDLDSYKLLWSNHRSEAKFRCAKLSKHVAVVAGSFGQDGYLQIYERRSGDLLHELVTLEGVGFHRLAVTRSRIVAQLSIRHRLLSSKLLVLDNWTGDLVAERSFVDILELHVVRNNALVLVHNENGDFRTRISVYDMQWESLVFNSERVLFMYDHNHDKLPLFIDDTSIVHTDEQQTELWVRDFHSFFIEAEENRGAVCMINNGNHALNNVQYDRNNFYQTLRRIYLNKFCAQCCSLQ